MKALILAGGKGTRLYPYTLMFPKPMLPVGGQPIIISILKQLYQYGFSEVIVSLGYMGEFVKAFLKSHENYNLPQIEFIYEDIPLGTTGPLSLINYKEDILVINGDILSTVDYGKVFKYHHEKNSDLTFVSVPKTHKLPFGVLEIKEEKVVSLSEKPEYTINDNAGIYVYSKKAIDLVPNKYIGVDEYYNLCMSNKLSVYAYEENAECYWIDIGRHADYDIANERFIDLKNKLKKRGIII